MADTFELNPDIIQSATGTIDGDIEQIETALYGREVRASIAEALYLLEQNGALSDAEIEAVKERLTKAEEQIDSVEEGLATAEGRIDSGEERLTAVEERVDSVEEGLSTAEEQIDSVEERLTSAEKRIDSGEKKLSTAEGEIDENSQQISDIWTAIENLDPSTATGILSQGSINGDEKNTYTLYSSGRCDMILNGSDFETRSTIDWNDGFFMGVTNVYVYAFNKSETIPYMLGLCRVPKVTFYSAVVDETGRGSNRNYTINPYTFYSSQASYNYWIEALEIDSSRVVLKEDAFNSLAYLREIIYNGLISQWEKLEKEDGWEGNMGKEYEFEGFKQYIRCTDGNLVRTVKVDSSGVQTYWTDWTREGSDGSVDSITNSEIDGIYSGV